MKEERNIRKGRDEERLSTSILIDKDQKIMLLQRD